MNCVKHISLNSVVTFLCVICLPGMLEISSDTTGEETVTAGTDLRVSEQKCRMYKEVLRESPGLLPLLPLAFVTQRRISKTKPTVPCKISPVQFIVGGRDAMASEFPHMVALGYGGLDENKWWCGGTLISENFVLTAAHCVVARNAGPVRRVLLGTVDLSKFNASRNAGGNLSIIVDVVERIPHPDYKNPMVYHDLALLRLQKNIRISKKIRPACLPVAKSLEKINSTLVTGWGRTQTGGSQSTKLKAVRLTRIDQQKCEQFFGNKPDKIYRFPQGILKSQLCAGAPGKDSCNGDSGGPLTVSKADAPCVFYVVGIVSFGSVHCGDDPGVYTNVQAYLNWIEGIVWPSKSRETSYRKK